MKPAPIKELATIDDLAKLDIRVGTIEAVGRCRRLEETRRS